MFGHSLALLCFQSHNPLYKPATQLPQKINWKHLPSPTQSTPVDSNSDISSNRSHPLHNISGDRDFEENIIIFALQSWCVVLLCGLHVVLILFVVLFVLIVPDVKHLSTNRKGNGRCGEDQGKCNEKSSKWGDTVKPAICNRNDRNS